MICRKCYKDVTVLYDDKYCCDCVLDQYEKVLKHMRKELFNIGKDLNTEENNKQGEE